MSSKAKCQNGSCNCRASGSGSHPNYCSESCAREHTGKCRCGHAGCGGA